MKENEQWESYYKHLELIKPEEWDTFKSTCQADLPTTFRVTSSGNLASEIQSAIDNELIPLTTGLTIEGEEIEAPKPIAFYPDHMAYQFHVSKAVIRKTKEFAKLQRFLVVETDAGHVSRQEAVSMVPPLFMDIAAHHSVLDMCAAPGSKTAQLIEALHKDESKTGARPTGVVIANDSDYKRSHLLVHQVKRLASPNLLVTNHDAQMYPKIKISETEHLKFDRILCDVPCSGDGTMRKNVKVWKEWKFGTGIGLHTLQLNILLRGIQLLKPGGRLVYSTCSLNPIENEAVVAEAIRRNGDKLTLVDVSNELPGLKRSPGVSTWKVANKHGKWVERGEPNVQSSLFPPSEKETDFSLERCVRVYPHQQDTGGFFIAVLEKRSETEEEVEKRNARKGSPLPEEASKKAKTEDITESEAPSAETVVEEPAAEKAAAAPVKKEKLPRDANEEPFVFLPSDHPVLLNCWNFYGIKEEFPRDSLLVRNAQGDPTRTIYYVDPALKPILQLNDDKLKFIHAGVKFFSHQRNTETCEWRIQMESILMLTPYLDKKRVITGTLDMIRVLATESFPKFAYFKENFPDFYSQIENIPEGCIVVQTPKKINPAETYLFPVWKGRGSCNLMIPKEDLHELRHRVFGIDVEKVRDATEEVKANAPKEAENHESSAAPTEDKTQEGVEK